MTNQASAQFVGDIPQFYDRCLGPVIFQDYASDLARRAAAFHPADVLEIASGTGISTVALRSALPSSTRIVATDLNLPMLEIARSKLPSNANVVFQQADALALPFANNTFDLIAVQFGVMFFPDKTAAFREARRVLKQDGALLFNVWSAMRANPFAEAAFAAGQRFLPDNPPKFYLTPFGYADVERACANLTAGGFGTVTHEIVRLNKLVPDLTLFARGLVLGNPLIADLHAANIDPDRVAAWIASELRSRFGDEPISMPLEAIVLSARA
ncbi:MAG: class I SAM-dependent methyltransferase [Proteobacteria bacterium]|nr:class I SAM-dependent methyltransferase [Pseudomonadota bacterium]